MSNKKIFKELYSKKIGKNNNYKAILESIERNNMKKKNNILKWVFVPVCLIIVISGVLFLNKNDNDIIYKPSNPIINTEQNYEIYINSVESGQHGLSKFDADVKRVNYYMIPHFAFLTNLVIPDDFDSNEEYRAVYVKKDVKAEEYDVLNNYELWCRNTNNDRKIYIAFSKEFEPLRDYYFGGEGKISKINNVELKIYKYNNSYMTTFDYNDINFDIETTDISEIELIDLLTSIIK